MVELERKIVDGRLLDAVRNGDIVEVTKLVKQGANPNIQN